MQTDMIKAIKKQAISKQYPDHTDYISISVEHVLAIAESFNASGRDVEIIALKHGIVPERYARNMKLFSTREQLTLLQSQVSVVGLGGLGGAVIEMLARIGIGTLNLIDGDIFEDSNLNRQFLSTHNLLSTPKSEAAFKRIAAINSSIVARPYGEQLVAENAVVLIRQSDVVVDCLDNVTTRFVLERAAKAIDSPLVSAAVAGSSGHVTSIFPEDHGLELVYGKQDGTMQQGAETSLGCLPQAVALCASIETSEVVKILLGKGSVLRNKLFVFDLFDNTLEVVTLV